MGQSLSASQYYRRDNQISSAHPASSSAFCWLTAYVGLRQERTEEEHRGKGFGGSLSWFAHAQNRDSRCQVTRILSLFFAFTCSNFMVLERHPHCRRKSAKEEGIPVLVLKCGSLKVSTKPSTFLSRSLFLFLTFIDCLL